jgi:hypothetical protein
MLDDIKELTFADLVNKFQRTAKGVTYERYMRALQLRLALGNASPTVKEANAGLVRMKDVGPLTVHQNATLTNISIQYANDEYIGEQLMPVVNATKKSDVYYIYDKRSRLAYPDDALGPRGQANEISDTRSTASYLCKPYGYENYVDGETIENQDAPLNEMVDLVEALAEGMSFRRELRIAAIAGVGSSFSGNTTAIGAASRWDSAGGGNPIKNIQDAIANTWSGRGRSELVMYSSYDVYLVLSRHPAILDLFKFTGTSPGLATPNMIAGFFGASRYLVGKARKDTANEGQTASYSRIWPDVLGVMRVAIRPSVRTAAFGYTLRHGPIRTIEWFDQRLGNAGGYFAKSSTSEDHKVVAGDTGFLITTPIG